MHALEHLLAISPVDGRYAQKVSPLRNLCSEWGLIRARIHVEILWFLHLCQNPEIAELPPLPSEAKQFLEQQLQQLSPKQALDVKTY
ncbi:MAG: adenylosuccinate lyase, partial [Myxococcota bacterium]